MRTRQVDRVIGHIELMSSQRDFVGKVQSVWGRVGLAVDLKTPIEKLDESVFV